MKKKIKVITLLSYCILFSFVTYISFNSYLFGYKNNNKSKEEQIIEEIPIFIKPYKIISVSKDKRGPTSIIIFDISNIKNNSWFEFHDSLSIELSRAGFSNKTGCRGLEFIMLLPEQKNNSIFQIEWKYPSNSCSKV